ncbi:MAG: Uma2 family endonuclease [Gemmatimonadaceae bacterium]|nr:Uma2 family endonuclease [Gemmatimonadaceae bacterium]
MARSGNGKLVDEATTRGRSVVIAKVMHNIIRLRTGTGTAVTLTCEATAIGYVCRQTMAIARVMRIRIRNACHLRFPYRRADRMRMQPALEFYTADMVRALPEDGNRYETVHGELLVTPSPRALHQEVLFRLAHALQCYLDEQPGVAHIFLSPADISWGPDILVQPDVFVVPVEQASTLDWKQVTTLLLAIEVLSPSSVRYDRFTKRRLYQEVGVATYWVVDADELTVEVWTPDAHFPAIERTRITWNPAKASAPFSIELAELFRAI